MRLLNASYALRPSKNIATWKNIESRIRSVKRSCLCVEIVVLNFRHLMGFCVIKCFFQRYYKPILNVCLHGLIENTIIIKSLKCEKTNRMRKAKSKKDKEILTELEKIVSNSRIVYNIPADANILVV